MPRLTKGVPSCALSHSERCWEKSEKLGKPYSQWAPPKPLILWAIRGRGSVWRGLVLPAWFGCRRSGLSKRAIDCGSDLQKLTARQQARTGRGEHMSVKSDSGQDTNSRRGERLARLGILEEPMGYVD